MPLREIKGGLLKSHNATTKTPAQILAETKRARIVALRNKGVPHLTQADKKELLDLMIEEWLQRHD